MKRWTLSQNAFDEFLAVLHPDREAAGLAYESLRTRIVKFFEWRSCSDPDALADEAFDRVIKKVASGEQIREIPRYLYGVAKLVFLESTKTKHREEAIIIDFPSAAVESEDDNEYLDCLEECLAKISIDSKSLILRYYSFDRQAKIDDRRRMAEALGMTLNALRIKALRVRAKVEECVKRCVQGK
jgi:DNA-directed RNA polymerase specialized sigma24 family protein